MITALIFDNGELIEKVQVNDLVAEIVLPPLELFAHSQLEPDQLKVERLEVRRFKRIYRGFRNEVIFVNVRSI